MDITASDGKFYTALMGLNKIDYEWSKNGLVFSTKEKPKYPLYVRTGRGDFVECVNAEGEVISEGGDDHNYYVIPTKEKQTLRFKKLPPIKLTAKELDEKRQKVTRWLVSDMPYSLGVPNDLEGVIKWFQDKLAEIPKACRASARVDFHSRMSYGETYENLKITYEEPETDDELKHRLQVEAERARVSKIKKQEQLEKLKAELGA